MKNRIISLLLVVVSCVLLLTGCAFNYQKKDLADYAEFNLDAFKALLATIEVEDGEFAYGDEDARNALVADEIYARLVKLAEAEDKVTTGTIAEKDILYYCYYVVATFDEKEKNEEGVEETVEKKYTFYATNMTASKFQTLALYDLEKEVDKKIMAAVLGLNLIEGETTYTTKTEGTAAGNTVVYVTYKETTPDGTTTEYTNKRVELPILPEVEEGETYTPVSFEEYLVGKEIAKTLTDFEVGEEGNKTKYSAIKIGWQVETGEEVVVNFDENPFTTTTSQKSDNGKTKNLKDAKDVEYHIYPVGRQEVEEFTKENGKLVFTTLLGDGISTTSLDCLSNAEYKYTEGDKEITIKSLVEELAGKYKALSDAKTAYDKTPANETLKKNYEDAKAAVADDKLDEFWAKMQKCADAKEDNLAEVMYTQYTEDVYDELEEDYNAEIKDKVTVELWKLIQDSVKNVAAPARAVKDAYKQNLEAFKYKYYTGKVNDSTATDAKTNLETYATFKLYLVDAAKKVATDELEKKDVKCETYNDAVAILNEYAEKQVKEHIVIWTVAKAFDIEVADTEIENFALLQSYYMQIYGYSITSDQILDQYGKENIRTYLAFDKLIGHFLEVEEDNADTDEDESKNGTAYKNITVKRNPPEVEEEEGDNTGDDNTGDNTGDDNTGDEGNGGEATE